MRAITLVKKVEFDFPGNVVRNGLTLGDVDNDGCNELVVGNDLGDIAIFKGKEHFQTISKLSFVACVAVGDIANQGKNSLVIITANGWCYIYEVPEKRQDDTDSGFDQVDGQKQSSVTKKLATSKTAVQSSSESVISQDNKKSNSKENPKNGLVCVHVQRIPANIKSVVLGDIDGDGFIEMVVGLTDRVVRSYRWSVDTSMEKDAEECAKLFGLTHKLSGNLVGLTKWESANQIGSITLNHSLDGKPSILVAQPGGTFMRIRCQDAPLNPDNHSNSSESQNFLGSVVDYQFLGISRMRNQNISTEILGDLKTVIKAESSTNIGSTGGTAAKSNPYAVATLDGTIMLVQDEIILWAIAVDHQIFALTKVDMTGDGSDDIVVCCWDGQTYILDQNKNSVRFHLEEPVRAFHSGWYSVNAHEAPVTAMVYVTFKNTIVIYYDIPLQDFTIKKFEPDLTQLSQLFTNSDRDPGQALEHVKSMDKIAKKDLIEFLLYSSQI